MVLSSLHALGPFPPDLPSNPEGEVTAVAAPPIENLAITTDPGVQQMPSVAVNPLDPDHVVIAYMDYSLPTADEGLPGEGYAGIGVAVSHDGGETWLHSSIPLPEPFDQGAANPVVRFGVPLENQDDAQEQVPVYVSFMAATFLGEEKPGLTNPAFGPDRIHAWQSNNGVFVVRSDDGGTSWNALVAVASHLYDGVNEIVFDIAPDMAIDGLPILPSGEPNENFGNIYVTWSRVYQPGHCPMLPDTPGNPVGGIQIWFAISRDGGMSWETQEEGEISRVGLDVVQFVEDEPFDICSGTNPGEGYVDYPHLAIGSEGEIYISYQAGGNFGFNVSRDGGLTFQPPSIETGDQIVFGLDFTTQVDPSGLPGNHFRTVVKRAIAPDPTQAGVIYAAEPIWILDDLGNVVDPADIYFGRSEDFAQSWETAFTVGSHPDLAEVPDGALAPLNDDNDARSAASLSPSEVTSGQAFSQIATDAHGSIGVIWYDTRRDPNNVMLDVFGTISTDGGRTFSPNFRISDRSFDANTGSFTNAIGEEEFYLGDSIGLAIANNMVYAAWTDAREGNQDIVLSRFPLDPAPEPLNDRYEPNDTSDRDASATVVGSVIQRFLPKLRVTPGDADWFSLEASATGFIRADVLFDDPASVPTSDLTLELWNGSGPPLAELVTAEDLFDSHGKVIGKRLRHAAHAGEEFLIRVYGSGSEEIDYSLQLESLTEDLGQRVHADIAGFLGENARAAYLVSAGATGSVNVSVTAGLDALGDLGFRILDPNTLNVLESGGQIRAGGRQQISLEVRQDQDLLILLETDDASMGVFSLAFVNLDLFTTPKGNTLFFPVPAGPSQASVADVNDDGSPDVVVASALSDTLSIMLGTENGLLQAPRQFPIGAFTRIPTDVTGLLPTFGRDVAIADFDGDDILDLVATNSASADISLLLGRGDGTVRPQRRFDATPAPFDLDVGDINADGFLDVVVIEAALDTEVVIAGLLNRGDGTFKVQRTSPVSVTGNNGTIRLGDFNEDGLLDVVASGDGGEPFLSVLFGNGDGTFTFADKLPSSRRAVALAVADIDGDGHLDVATAGFGGESPFITILLGNGDGTFQPKLTFSYDNSAAAMEIDDFGSQIELSDGSTTLGPPDGRPDILLANSGASANTSGLAREIVVRPGLFDDQGRFLGLGDPQRLAGGDAPQDLDVGDLNGDDALDIVVVDREGILVVYGQPPDIAPETARDLGTVVHLVDQTQTLVPGRERALFTFSVPTEAVGIGDEVLDVSLLFEHMEGPGIDAELRDADGMLLGSGERFRVRAKQGEELTLEVFSKGPGGFGAFTPIINVLPQVVSLEADSLLPGIESLPGGPISSIVITFQGDRLDAGPAEDPNNYTVTHAGADGQFGTADDQVIPVGGAGIERPVVYNPSANVDITTGLTFPTAIRQTVTLVFAEPLPPGSYRVELSERIETQPFNDQELELLANREVFGGHPVVEVNGRIATGARVEAVDLVLEAVGLGDFSVFEAGTRFVTQLQNDLQTLVDAVLSEFGDDAGISQLVLDHILDRIVPGLGSQGERLTSMLIIFFDPGSLLLSRETDPSQRVDYDKQDNTLVQNLSAAYAQVGRNVDLLIVPQAAGRYEFAVADVPSLPRSGALVLSNTQTEFFDLTAAMRDGQTRFSFLVAPELPPLAAFLPSASSTNASAVTSTLLLATAPSTAPSVSAADLSTEQRVLSTNPNSLGSGRLPPTSLFPAVVDYLRTTIFSALSNPWAALGEVIRLPFFFEEGVQGEVGAPEDNPNRVEEADGNDAEKDAEPRAAGDEGDRFPAVPNDGREARAGATSSQVDDIAARALVNANAIVDDETPLTTGFRTLDAISKFLLGMILLPVGRHMIKDPEQRPQPISANQRNIAELPWC